MENCNIKPITLQRNFLEATGNRVSYYYARNIYRSFYKQLLRRCQCDQKCFIETANLFENTHSRCSAGLQPGTSPVVSLSKIFSISKPIFRNTCECFSHSFFFLTAMCQARTYSLCFFVTSKNQTPCTFFYKLITFNSN